VPSYYIVDEYLGELTFENVGAGVGFVGAKAMLLMKETVI